MWHSKIRLYDPNSNSGIGGAGGAFAGANAGINDDDDNNDDDSTKKSIFDWANDIIDTVGKAVPIVKEVLNKTPTTPGGGTVNNYYNDPNNKKNDNTTLYVIIILLFLLAMVGLFVFGKPKGKTAGA